MVAKKERGEREREGGRWEGGSEGCNWPREVGRGEHCWLPTVARSTSFYSYALSPYSSLTFHHYIHPPPHPSLSLSSTPYDQEVREHTCTHASGPWLFLRVLSQNPSRFSPFSFSFPLFTTPIFFPSHSFSPSLPLPVLSLLSLFLTHLSVAPCW